MTLYVYLRSSNVPCIAANIFLVAIKKTQLVYFSIIFVFYTSIKVNAVQQPHFPYGKLEHKYKPIQSSLQLENKCSPKLKLLNCGARTGDMPRISPYKSAVILSNVDVDASCTDLERVLMRWEVWLVTNNRNVRTLEFFDKQNYFVEQGSLSYGIYKVKLQSNVVFSNKILSVNASCYFEMVRLPVQTVIVGGSKRHKFFKNPISLEILTLVIPDVCEFNEGTGKIPRLKIIYEWQCDSGDNFCSPFKTTNNFREIIGPFTQFKEYNFSLKVQTMEKHSSYTKALSQQPEFQAIKMDSISELELSIECLMNCGGSVFKSNPQEIIHLEANLNTDFEEKKKSIIYNWNYTVVGSVEKTVGIDEIREKGTVNKVFVVKRNKLIENKKYMFTVSVGNSSYAELVIHTCSLPKSPNCTISPKSGIRGETYFNINCSIPKQEEDFLSIRFEFFDRYINEDFGRYLGLSVTGVLQRVVLTRDRLFVRAINVFGAYSETVITLQLTPFTQNKSETNLKIDGNHLLGNYIYRIGLITAYGDYLNSEVFSSNLTNLLLKMLQDEETYVEEISGATLLINALHNILCNTSNKIQYLESKTTKNIAKIMYDVSKIAKETVTNPFKSSRYITTKRLLEISNYIINCSSELLGSSSTNSYNILDNLIYHDVKIGAFHIMESLNDILTAVAFKVLVSFKQINLDSKYIEVILLNIGPKLENIAQSSGMTQITLNVTRKFLKKFPEFQIQIINFKKMPFWWASRPGGEINTNIFDLKLKNGADFILINETNENFSVDFNVVDFKPLMIHGSVNQPNRDDSPDVNDFLVAVHRIRPVVYSRSFVKFVGIEDNTTLRAIILQDQRPDFDYMNSNAITITNKSSCLNLTMAESENDLFLYLGILPGEDFKTGEIVNYTFELFTVSCKIRRYESWMMGSKCKVSDKTNKKQVLCVCSMLTVTLGGLVFVPPHEFNPFSDIPLFISASDDPLAIILIVVVVILYAILLLWTNRKDKRNQKKVNFIVLEDNDERDTCGYLVGVFTGSRIRAGTTSNVGIMLLGEEGMSRSHILKSKLRPTLQSNCDDWFILYTRHHLGSLTNIILWMDYSGSSPHWYCRKIFVCDLQKYDTDTFYVESWFGINIKEIHLKTVKECATYKEINKVSRIISENLEYGFRENHLWLSLFVRHPRSLVCSKHRLTVAFCSLFVTMGVSALIYSLFVPQMEDHAHYRISKDTFVYGIISGLVGGLFSFVTLHFFKTSYKLVPCPSDYHEHLDGATIYHLERQISLLVEDPLWLQAIKKLIRLVKPCRVLPVQRNENDLVGIKINRKQIAFAVILCIIISVLNIHLIVIFGIHFGEIKSLLWLTSLFIGMVQIVCITLPLKILVTSLMLVVLKKRYFPLMSHIIQMNQTILGSLRRKSNEEFSEHLTRRKTLLKSYRPLPSFSELEFKSKQIKITVMWTSLYTFGCVLFLAIVAWLILNFDLYELCDFNTIVCREIDTREACKFSHYSRLNNFDQFLNEIQKMILPVVYSRFWYNGESRTLETEAFPNSGWLGDADSRLIGPPRLRQIRVKSIDNCDTPQFMLDNSSHCFVRLNAETEETGKYSTGWVSDNWIDCQFGEESWHFTDAKQAMGAVIRTPSGYVCHGGGYVLSLQRSENDAKLVLRNIIDTNWIDSHTRVLMLEFTVYNANKDVYTSVVAFAEATPFRTIVANQFVHSVKLSYLPASGIVFLAYFFVFLLRVLILMNIMGIGNFLKNLWNLQEVIILVSYLASAIYYINTLLLKEKYRRDIRNQGKDVYFQVQILNSEISLMKDMICVLFCLVAFRMLRIVRFNADVRQYLHDLYSAIRGIVWIWVVLSLFIFVQWRLVMFLVVPPPGDSFKDILVYQSDFKMVIYQYQDMHGKILAFMISLLTQIGMFSYVCSLTHYYRKGQLKRNPPPATAPTRKRRSRYSDLWGSTDDINVPQ